VKASRALEVGLVVVLGIAVLGATLALAQRRDEYTFFDELIEVKRAISDRFVTEPDQEKLRDGAIRGMVEALNDPYTVYVPASEARDFNKELTGEYVGIGASVGLQDGWFTIMSPLEDSPAFRVGLMSDDRVIEIDGVSTQGKSVDDCIEQLLGEAGTTVRLTIERSGVRSEVSIVRERIKTRSVKGFHRSPSDPNAWEFTIDPARGIAYIRLTQFTPGLTEEFVGALIASGVEDGKVKGLVLDVRFNPGGLLNEAEQIADLFLKDGVIVSTKGRAHPEEITRAEEPGTLPDFPVVVLINGQSASASEVLAGALTENNRAIALGSRSFGKGSVQSVLNMQSGKGSELKLTEQGYYLPSGRSITRRDDSPTWGVDPSPGFYVPMQDEEIVAMFEVRRREEVLRAGPAPAPRSDQRWDDPSWILAELKDPQLSAAVGALQKRIDTGAWAPVSDASQQTSAVAGEELRRARLVRDRMLRELERIERRVAAIEDGNPGAIAENTSFWDDTIDPTGGTIEIKDKEGKLISRLKITGRDLERWLLDADLKPEAATP
jgi:carboxyl-terminal processing protease